MEVSTTNRDNQRQADLLPILAGFFAGEGSIGIRRSNKRSKTPTIWLEVGNTERAWCERFRQTFGGRVRVRIARKRLNHLPYYKWYVKDEAAGRVLNALLPFLLGEKRPQAEIAIAAVAIKAAKPFRGRAGKLGHFSPEAIAALERLATQLLETRRAAAETKRAQVEPPPLSDSPILPAMAATVLGQASASL